MKKILFYLVISSLLISNYSCEEEEEVNTKPSCIITTPTAETKIIIGDTVNISVEAEDPDGEINDVRLYIDSIGISSDNSFPYNFNWYTADATIGVHSIKIVVTDNKNAKTEKVVNVTIRDVDGGKPLANTLTISNIASGTVTLNGIVNPNGLETTVSFEYGTSSEEYDNVAFISQGDVLGKIDIDVEAKLDGLDNDILYYYRLKAKNDKGTTYGADSSFRISENFVEDGVYVRGASTTLTDLNADGLMKVTRNEVLQEDRSSLKELYVAVKAGSEGFNIVDVSCGEETIYGPGADFALVSEADLDNDEPKEGLWKGAYTETETQFTVPEDGLYHVMLDTEVGKIAVARVKWGLIGGATSGGWGESTEMTASFDLNKMEFVVAEVTMLESEYKFRYSNSWKVILDPDIDLGGGQNGVKVNTNFGGSLDNLVPGGDNITQSTYAIYKYTMIWELGVGISVTEKYVADGPLIPEYPEAMYIVGTATAYGWDEPGTVDNAIMHKIAGGDNNDGIFWKICHLAAGEGFKLSAAAWGAPNLGFAGVDEFDTEGITVSDNGGNMSVTEDGMYIVVLDLRNDLAKVSIKNAAVYGIGDAFGANDWAEDAASCIFTIDNANKTLTSPALTASNNIRMYASHTWIPDWWNAEFNVYNTTIEYRNDGGDQSAVAGADGQVVTLHFDDNTGSIQ